MALIQQKFIADHDRILSKMREGTFGQVLECLDKENVEHLVHVDGRPPNVIAKLMGLDGLPPQQPQPLHRHRKGFSETYLQWTASVSSQRDGKPYEHRSNRKDSMAQQEYRILSKMGEGTFGQVLECLDNESVEHLGMIERLLGPLPQHMITGASLRAEKYFKRSAHLDWLEGASSKESTRAVWKLPRLQCNIIAGTFGQVLECLDNENLEHLGMMERLLGPLPQHIIIGAGLRAEKYFKRSAHLDWLEGPSSKESARAIWKLPRLQRSFCVYIAKCMFVTVHVDGRPPNVIARLIGLDGLPSRQPLHRQHKGFSKTYRQWTASVSSQRDGKPYELRSNRKDSMGQQECKDEYEVLETSKVERSSYQQKGL
ncbi:serine/threonine-protein kinase AFC1-like [Camellia sinensis]|uniref:serine/threonine-protein kinase AFC1-like n=1 Tax=Camellia sinensis TaxID=4442 RepID=UPI0010359967|nr:serine/threonine-protein kinase AFC1-like [Camellia sinensis]